LDALSTLLLEEVALISINGRSCHPMAPTSTLFMTITKDRVSENFNGSTNFQKYAPLEILAAPASL